MIEHVRPRRPHRRDSPITQLRGLPTEDRRWPRQPARGGAALGQGRPCVHLGHLRRRRFRPATLVRHDRCRRSATSARDRRPPHLRRPVTGRHRPGARPVPAAGRRPHRGPARRSAERHRRPVRTPSRRLHQRPPSSSRAIKARWDFTGVGLGVSRAAPAVADRRPRPRRARCQGRRRCRPGDDPDVLRQRPVPAYLDRVRGPGHRHAGRSRHLPDPLVPCRRSFRRALRCHDPRRVAERFDGLDDDPDGPQGGGRRRRRADPELAATVSTASTCTPSTGPNSRLAGATTATRTCVDTTLA